MCVSMYAWLCVSLYVRMCMWHVLTLGYCVRYAYFLLFLHYIVLNMHTFWCFHHALRGAQGMISKVTGRRILLACIWVARNNPCLNVEGRTKHLSTKRALPPYITFCSLPLDDGNHFLPHASLITSGHIIVVLWDFIWSSAPFLSLFMILIAYHNFGCIFVRKMDVVAMWDLVSFR